MATRFQNYAMGVTAPALGAVAITPSDSVDLAEGVCAVTLGGAGTLSFIGTGGTTYTTGMLPVGTYSLFARRILATGTTATDITGWI
ncbi:spike base protein, RCAP_Rcc01079 family [Falsirhodobacter deserti]|uniref:spike base protein, RCAP_Rcc01079 family n=1 Tax=Falsirhodobacter deserti TaxID=1365611 RepID=UPI000FE2A05E|nr:hypothetical protein [Falsirhodobacter deserti]